MRPLESTLLVWLLIAILSLFRSRERRAGWARWLPGLAALLAVLQLLAEGYRWQMVPAYALSALLVLLSARAVLDKSQAQPAASLWRKLGRIAAPMLLLLVLGSSAALSLAFPMFELPEPSGTYAVGSTRLSLVDASRPETLSAEPDDRRELLIQIWYPAVAPAADARPAALWDGGGVLARQLAQSLSLPRFAFDHLAKIPTHTFMGLPLTDTPRTFPVLIFSHGYSQGFVAQNTSQMEELASHGYVIFSIGHPYESGGLVHPDGRVVPLSAARMQKVQRELGQGRPLYEKLIASSDAAEKSALSMQLSKASPTLAESLAIWTADTRFVLDWLEAVNAGRVENQFTGRLDLAHLGVFGMSFGGATAGQVTLLDGRVRAGANLDGLQFGAAMQQSLPRPFMIMTSQSGREINAPLFERAAGPVYQVTIEGAEHFDFTDSTLIAPVFRLLGVMGPVPGMRMTHIYTDYTLAFFDRHLRSQGGHLLNGPSPSYPEVQFRSRNTAPAAVAQMSEPAQ